MMRAPSPATFVALTALTGLIAGGASEVEAQCRMDLLESGIEAYRALDLVTASEHLNEAVTTNGSSQCGTANARALAYLGAAHWLGERPDSAMLAFERAVVQAPRFRPDPLEFPPAVTDLFDRVRRETPAVAVTLPDLVEIGPSSSSETFRARLTASVDHRVSVTLRSGEAAVRTLYDGRLEGHAEGSVVEWDGRDEHGEAVRTGWYDLQIVSRDEYDQPLRMVVIALSVESDATELSAGEPEWVEVVDTIGVASGGRSVWKAVAVGGAGLLAGAAVVAGPMALEGGSASWARYPIAGSLGLAGIIGFFKHLGGGEPEVLTETRRVPATPPSPPPTPTLLIRPAQERRVELGETSTRSEGHHDDPASGGSS